MSLPSATLQAIQQAGAAVFEADALLKRHSQDYAQQVQAAVLGNPYHLGNDSLFEHRKIVARLSQTLAAMEAELRKVYQVAGELGDDEPTTPLLHALTAPLPAQSSAPSTPAAVPEASNVTDVQVKKSRSGAPARPAPVRKSKAMRKVRARRSGNASRLMGYLERVLNAGDFVAIKQGVVGREAGIPPGSINAAFRQLLTGGQIIAGPSGHYKLAR